MNMTISQAYSQLSRHTLSAVALGIAVLVSGCGGDNKVAAAPPVDNTPSNAIFEVTLVNLTAGQPLSPMLAIVHNDGFTLFKEGDIASVALEYIAESGNTAPLSALIADSKSVITSASGPATPLVPGPDNMVKLTLTVPLSSLATSRLSFASMLGNTNDGFTGVNAESLANLALNASRTIDLLAYDAGTEANTESADTVPGPATANASGKHEGFNPMRDDVISTIHIHPGVVSKDDGLPGSALTQAQRWDNPVATLKIRRTQ
jgi:hypothetical protein